MWQFGFPVLRSPAICRREGGRCGWFHSGSFFLCFLTVNLPLLIGSRSFPILIFAFPSRVCERQRPFNHSCAVRTFWVSGFGGGRSQPQALARGLAFEPLENAAQPGAHGGGNDGQRIALVIRTSLRAEDGNCDDFEGFHRVVLI